MSDQANTPITPPPGGSGPKPLSRQTSRIFVIVLLLLALVLAYLAVSFLVGESQEAPPRPAAEEAMPPPLPEAAPGGAPTP